MFATFSENCIGGLLGGTLGYTSPDVGSDTPSTSDAVVTGVATATVDHDIVTNVDIYNKETSDQNFQIIYTR